MVTSPNNIKVLGIMWGHWTLYGGGGRAHPHRHQSAASQRFGVWGCGRRDALRVGPCLRACVPVSTERACAVSMGEASAQERQALGPVMAYRTGGGGGFGGGGNVVGGNSGTPPISMRGHRAREPSAAPTLGCLAYQLCERWGGPNWEQHQLVGEKKGAPAERFHRPTPAPEAKEQEVPQIVQKDFVGKISAPN